MTDVWTQIAGLTPRTTAIRVSGNQAPDSWLESGMTSRLDEPYRAFLHHYQGVEIIPDIELFDYERALRENAYVERHFALVAQHFWMMGRSGQGDEWFLDDTCREVWFYDYDQGEYTLDGFVSMGVGIVDFVQAAFLFRALEDCLDNGDELSARQMYQQLQARYPELCTRYPYHYFE